MSRTCDLCGKPVEPGQPRYGAKGAGDRTGPRMGSDRHYSCHADKFGRPPSTTIAEELGELRRAVGLPDPPPSKPVKAPAVTRGEYNRSDNAARSFELYDFVSEMGRRRGRCDCPFCGESFWIFVWSLCGGGKKCPNCKAKFGSYGRAYPLVGNEDL